MPTPEQILSGLGELASKWRLLAIVWHVYFGALALYLMLGVRPSKRSAAVLLGLPLLSVSVLAWLSGNPFNGTFFALTGSALLVVSIRLPRERAGIALLWAVIPGAVMFVFGWVYPHFLNSSSFLAYLYAAPTGLIPCPTLSMVIGLALILGSCGSRVLSIVLGATGIFYGLFGAVRLGVAIDWVLLLGALMITLSVFVPSRPGSTV